MSGRLAGRNCLIVGGTGGIGLASARRFLDEGARVVVTGRSDEACAEALTFLRPRGDVGALTVEVADPISITSAFDEALIRFEGRLDVLLHVAGISGRRFGDGPLHDCTEAGWQTVLDTNARGVFLTNRAAVRCMLTQVPDDVGLRGTIVNTGSVLGHAPSPEFFGTFAYAASKGALRAMTRTAAAAYAAQQIRFNLLSPGLIDTPMAARAVGDPTIRAFLSTKQPLTAGPGSVDDCAEAALFLCEPATRGITGIELTVDGGWCVAEGQIPER